MPFSGEHEGKINTSKNAAGDYGRDLPHTQKRGQNHLIGSELLKSDLLRFIHSKQNTWRIARAMNIRRKNKCFTFFGFSETVLNGLKVKNKNIRTQLTLKLPQCTNFPKNAISVCCWQSKWHKNPAQTPDSKLNYIQLVALCAC